MASIGSKAGAPRCLAAADGSIWPFGALHSSRLDSFLGPPKRMRHRRWIFDYIWKDFMNGQSFVARKSVAAIIAGGEAAGHNLAKTLRPISITAMGVGAIIGAGIFALTGTAAAHYA